MFEVGERVRYVHDPENMFSYVVPPNNFARVSSFNPENPEYPLNIRFQYDSREYPVSPDELFRIDKEGNRIG